MDGVQERVVKQVALTVVIGQKSQLPQGGGGFGGGRGGRGGGGGGRGGGGFDPAAIFAQRDADGDGKLAGDEISGRMRENIEAMDTDGDGAITLEEFQARMQQFRGGGGGGGGGRRGGGGGGGGRRGGGGDEGGSERPQRPGGE